MLLLQLVLRGATFYNIAARRGAKVHDHWATRTHVSHQNLKNLGADGTSNASDSCMMNRCENCGNDYYKSFSVVMQDKEHFFDSFECAINTLAPQCEHCGTRIIGHGVESNQRMFCCAHCAKAENVQGLIDHVG